MKIDGQAATIQFAGLTPGYAGLYQINLVVPATARDGDLDVVIVHAENSSHGAGVGLAGLVHGVGTLAKFFQVAMFELDACAAGFFGEGDLDLGQQVGVVFEVGRDLD